MGDHGARPPHFTMQWQDSRTLLLTYESSRQMADLAVGMLRGVGEFYGEDLEVTRLEGDRIRVVFPS